MNRQMDKSGTQLNQRLGYDITHYAKVLSRDRECATLQSISTEELFHPKGGIPCQSQSKLSRGLLV